MAQKLLKHELVERLLQLKEKQDLLTVQMQLLAQEISDLAVPFIPKDVWGDSRTGTTVSRTTAIC